MIDFNVFFERIYTAMICTRLQLVFSVCVVDTFAAKCFGAFSASAKLRVIEKLCSAPIVEVE